MKPLCSWSLQLSTGARAGQGGRKRVRAFSLLEVLAVATVLAIISAVLLPRFFTGGTAKKTACYTLLRNIEVQAQLWRRHKGAWPATNLSDLAADPAYLPEGLPTCPVDGSAYTLDPATHRILGHTH
jgi:prepilin-type N-terminal cleavage/methylation domain-containing protein